jgi:hypothetical protein
LHSSAQAVGKRCVGQQPAAPTRGAGGGGRSTLPLSSAAKSAGVRALLRQGHVSSLSHSCPSAAGGTTTEAHHTGGGRTWVHASGDQPAGNRPAQGSACVRPPPHTHTTTPATGLRPTGAQPSLPPSPHPLPLG